VCHGTAGHGTTRPPAFARGRTRYRRAVGLVIPCRVASCAEPGSVSPGARQHNGDRPHDKIVWATRERRHAGDQPRSVVGSADHLPRRGLAARVSEPSNEVSRDLAERPGAISHEADSTGRRTRAATSCATAWSYAGDHPRRAEGPDRQRLHQIRTGSVSGETGGAQGDGPIVRRTKLPPQGHTTASLKMADLTVE
jgi:hypothetical protein